MPDRDVPADTIAATVADIASELDDVEVSTVGDRYELRRGSRVFAVVDRNGAEFRLRPDIAEAVLRTPDTAPSRRGNDWIRFEPKVIDASVEDRITAWLTTAWRAAGS